MWYKGPPFLLFALLVPQDVCTHNDSAIHWYWSILLSQLFYTTIDIKAHLLIQYVIPPTAPDTRPLFRLSCGAHKSYKHKDTISSAAVWHRSPWPPFIYFLALTMFILLGQIKKNVMTTTVHVPSPGAARPWDFKWTFSFLHSCLNSCTLKSAYLWRLVTMVFEEVLFLFYFIFLTLPICVNM